MEDVIENNNGAADSNAAADQGEPHPLIWASNVLIVVALFAALVTFVLGAGGEINWTLAYIAIANIGAALSLWVTREIVHSLYRIERNTRRAQ